MSYIITDVLWEVNSERGYIKLTVYVLNGKLEEVSELNKARYEANVDEVMSNSVHRSISVF